MNRRRYIYSTLRYVHDIASQEFFVVGVAVYDPETGESEFRFRKSLGLAGELFDSRQLSNFRAVMRSIDSRSKLIKESHQSILRSAVGECAKFDDVLLDFFPKDDSALRWSPQQSGLASDLPSTADRLYQRYCAKYDRTKHKVRTSDKDALTALSKKLTARRLGKYFSEKAIKGRNDEVKFPLAWKNGIWHCIEPVSFDLSDAEAIRDKAHKRVGEMVGIRDSNEAFAVYYVLTPPEEGDLDGAFDRAKGILSNAPLETVEVFEQEDADALLQRFAEQIARHEELDIK